MRQKLYYGWIVAAVTFLVLLVGAGVRATPGVLIVPLQREFGWSTAAISAPIAVNIFLFGMLGPFAVAVIERFGLRRSVSAALFALAAGAALTTLMTSVWQMLLLWGVVVGAGSGMVSLVLGATVAGRWFTRHRGVVLGLLTASSATGQLVFLPVLARLTVSFGWRTASLTVAACAAVAIPLAALLLRDRPSDIGLPRYGEVNLHMVKPTAENPVNRALSALAKSLRLRDFWLLSGTFFICGASTVGLIGTHMIPLCVDRGVSEVAAAGLLAMMGVFDLIGTTASGWLTDRYDSRKLLAWYYGLRGLALIFLPLAFDFSVVGLPVFAMFYGLDWIATIPPTVRLSARAFGEDNAALMFGWIAAAHQLGGAAAAGLAGVVRTQMGDYFAAFVTAGLMCLLAAVLALLIRNRPSSQSAATAAPAAG